MIVRAAFIMLIVGVAAAGQAADKPPVAFTYLGFDDAADPQGTRLRFEIAGKTAVSQVDVEFTFFNAAGERLGGETYAWQNVVKSKRLPIEPGKTYETDRGPFQDGAARAEAKLVRVIFTDGSRWSVR